MLGTTSGSAATDLFFAGTPPLSTGEVGQVVVTFEVVASSGTASVEIQRAYQLSNDGISWDTAVAFTADNAWVSSLGFDYGSATETIPVTSRFVRVGFQTNQKAGTDIEQIRVNVNTNLIPR
ncbi:MAG: hypothetical protein H6738_05240 [Alphaproteobacteria bacterium]|nr:hypothetical protein [Alphaproteobacteria bacterium]MCB9696171.1 hypothetical protein [Alphaproteobacteria bacterium]